MENPFNEINERLERIENLLTDHHQMKVEPPDNEEEKLMNVKEAASFLGESRKEYSHLARAKYCCR